MSDQITPRPRQAGLRGVRASHAPEGLKLHNLAKADAMQAPLPVSADVGGGISNWGMLGNGPDPANLKCYPGGAGCCGVSMTGHARMAKAVKSVINGHVVYDGGFRPPHTPYTQELYIAYQHWMGEQGTCPDNGVDNLTWFTWLYEMSKTTPGDDLVAFAEVDLTNIPAGMTEADVIHRAMIDFRGACVAVSLPHMAEAQFGNGEFWSVGPGNEPDPNEAHDIWLGAYGATPKGVAPGYDHVSPNFAGDWFVTWGEWQAATVAWDSAAISDVWVIMTREDAEAAGYDYDKAITAIEAMIEGHGPA